MKIDQSTLHSESSTRTWQSTRHQSETSMTFTVPETVVIPATQTEISEAGLSAQQAEALDSTNSENDLDPRLQLLIAIIEAMTGRHVKRFNTADLGQTFSTSQASTTTETTSTNNVPVWSVRLVSSSVHEESEQTRYSASGQVTTADGRAIGFSLDLLMQRYERQESSTVIEIGNAPKAKDPLVLNLATDQVRLDAGEFSFDLNVDGKTERISRLATGSAFLALDKNGNGRIDDGSELFGPTSGDGFKELSAFDQDGNGWIDENDPVFNQLKVWRPDESSQSLKKANIGAISLDHLSTAFSLKVAGETAGSVRTSGIFLSEDGVAGTMQQIDLVV
ncbi:MAG: hypothetical protein H6R19_1799 [Proteobacteria bacterium]|nr:hypothetical protein [Pseudomonadota bacterium]